MQCSTPKRPIADAVTVALLMRDARLPLVLPKFSLIMGFLPLFTPVLAILRSIAYLLSTSLLLECLSTSVNGSSQLPIVAISPINHFLPLRTLYRAQLVFSSS